jgi:hypothetical protein
MQTDPVGYGPSPNLYAYVLGDPVNLVDPLGLIQDDSIIVTAPRLTDIGTVIFRAWAWRRSRFFDFDIGEAGTRGHAFQTKNQVCARSLTSREMSDLLSKFAVPGHAGQSLTAGTYFVSARFGLPGPGGRTLPGGFVRTTFERGGLRVINIALDVHVFGGPGPKRYPGPKWTHRNYNPWDRYGPDRQSDWLGPGRSAA